MTTGSICGKLFPESRKWPSPNSSFPTNAISVAARTSWLCRYSMSRAQGHIRAQLIGDRANHIQLKERHRRAAGYSGPFLLWGFLLSFFLFWSWACYSAMLKYPKTASSMEYPLGLLGLLVLGCVIGLVLTSRKVSLYNQAVFPVLYSTWARTYMCRRCGKLLHIPS